MLGFILWLSFVSAASADGLRDSVVKIFVTSNSMDDMHPWQSHGSEFSTASGCVISGNRILTNAHVVSHNTFIQVRKEADPEKFIAHVEAIGYDCDLAILTVDDQKFFEGITPAEFGDLPKLQDSVTVIGFPLGGDKLSVTEGVISRIEIIPYTESTKNLLAVQIDAAINPGNSGGPVFQNGKLVGIAMQMMVNTQGIGYMIPTVIINHFLSDWNDKKYDGFPSLGIDFNNTENKTLRKFYEIENEKGGVLITRVYPYSAAYGKLESGDVILEVDGIPIGVDGTFQFRQDDRLSLSHLINDKYVGEDIVIKFFRHGKIRTQTLKLDRFDGLIPSPNYFEKPPYYIYGGLVFTVLTADLIGGWGKNWWEKAPIDFLYYLLGTGSLNVAKKKELVVLLEVLPDDLNVGYHNYRNEIIGKVNGKDFQSFQEFVQLVENSKQNYTIFETERRLKIIIPTDQALQSTAHILQRNNIPAQFSEDVAGWLKRKNNSK